MLRILITISCFFFVLSLQAQQELTWEELEEVTFNDMFSVEVGDYYSFPTFGQGPMDLNNQVVKLTGYIIPVDVEKNYYVLSRYTFNMCYFCGKAGPETIVQLKFSEGQRQFFLDERATFKGVFRLNEDDVNLCNYLLIEAEELRN